MKRILDLVESAAALSGEARAEAAELVAAAMQSRDAREGQKAFLEKRKPRFTGD